MIALADRQPSARQLRRSTPGVYARAYPVTLGLWAVQYARRGRPSAGRRPPLVVLVEDRSGDVLEWSAATWPPVLTTLTPFRRDVELVVLGLGVLFLLAFFDLRRPLRLVNLDFLVVLSFGASLAFFDRGEPLVSVPLIYPPLVYLLVRLLIAGFRGTRVRGPLVPWASERVLGLALVLLLAARVALNLALGQTNDVSYASVFGANSIHHGLPLYAPGHTYLDTYGPIAYLAYLPFELVFPLGGSWQHDYLSAAHAAAITFDLLTVLGLFLLGRRLRAGTAGRQLGITLAFAWAACPLTFFPLALSTNDGLVPLFVVYALLALSSPVLRGALLGLAAAAKFAPLALAGLLAAGRGERRARSTLIFGLAMAVVVGASVWAYLPGGGLHVFWSQTLGFQLRRHSFLSLWGQQPELRWLQTALKAATLVLAASLFALPRRRDTVQVAALAGAVLVALELTVVYWNFVYLVWFVPFLLVGLFAAPEGARATCSETDVEHRAQPGPVVMEPVPA
ncbi:MAG TPA: glycosyltransferase 87 family protein [Solirubrobacteraceae bacterium]|nr:glycosyltransferase 87 family protein [Solirubrobacteraceae bacterium]